MSDQQIDQLTNITNANLATGDEFIVRDASADGTDAETKAILVSELDLRWQPLDAQLTDIAALTPTDSNFIVGDGSNFVLEDAATARISLGLVIGTNVQAWDAQLDDLAALAPTKGRLAVGDGSNWLALDVGTDTHVLTLDSAQSLGVKWAAAAGGGGGQWSTDSNVVNLNTDTDTVTIGSATAGGKLFIDGDADEIQLQVQANSSQATNIVEVQDSGGTDLVTIDGSGNLDLIGGYLEYTGSRILHNLGGESVSIGAGAGANLSAGISNVFIGANAGNANDTSRNTLIGRYAGRYTAGTKNTVIGSDTAGNVSFSGDENVVIGSGVGTALTSGSNNVLIGSSAGATLSTGSTQVFIGRLAGNKVAAGTENNFIGGSAGQNTTGSANTAFGTSAGRFNTSGSSNTYLGADTGPANGDGTHSISIAIGRGALITASNQLVIGDDSFPITDSYFGEGVTSATPQNITFNATGGSGTDIAGANLTIAGGKGTGSGAGGSVIFQVAAAGGSGSSLNSLATVLTMASTGVFTFADAVDLAFNTTTGTKIGTATGQKIGFWNVTPVIQPAAANQAALTNSTGGSRDGTLAAVSGSGDDANINNNFTDIHELLDEIRTALVNTGIIKGAA